MIRYVLSMGLNDKDTKTQKIQTLEAYKMVENVIKSLQFEGATIYESKGLYKHKKRGICYRNLVANGISVRNRKPDSESGFDSEIGFQSRIDRRSGRKRGIGFMVNRF